MLEGGGNKANVSMISRLKSLTDIESHANGFR